MNFETFDLITNISSLSSLIPLLVLFIAVLRTSQPNAVKVLGALVFTSAIAELLTFMLYETFHVNPNPVINLYVLLQFIFLVWIYRISYTRLLFKRLTLIGIVSFTAFAVFNCFFIEGYNNINSSSFTVSGIALLFYCLLYFYQLVEELPEQHVERIFMFWISAGVFMYFGTNLFLFATVDKLIASGQEQFMLSWGMHNGMNVVKNILFGIGLYVSFFDWRDSNT